MNKSIKKWTKVLVEVDGEEEGGDKGGKDKEQRNGKLQSGCKINKLINNCLYLCTSCACVVYMQVRIGHLIPRTRIEDSCDPPCGHWESNLGLL